MTSDFQLTPTELQIWLEWAGARLIAMPGPRIKPADPKVIWPDYEQEKFEVTTFRGALPVRAVAPSSKEVPIVEEILLLPNVCEHSYTRRVLHARSLVHPINGRYLYRWTRIAELLAVKTYTVRRWHKDGLLEVISKAPRDRVCRIAAFVSQFPLSH
jgi:hypothetical protein